MSLQGAKMGLDLHVVRVSEDDDVLIFRGDLRFAAGTVDYSSDSTGSASGEPDWYIEARALVGKDWAINEAVISPYTGLGYRYLFNDGRGITSTGYGGYQTPKQLYLFACRHHPSHRAQGPGKTGEHAGIRPAAGRKQISSLSDVGAGYSDVTNNQSSGYGLKMSVMYQKDKWAIGPYLYYWNIGQSDIVPEIKNGVPTGYWPRGTGK